MRIFAAILAILWGTGLALGQTAGAPAGDKPVAAKPAAAKPAPKPKPKPAAKPRKRTAVVPRAETPATTGSAPDARPEQMAASQSVRDSYTAIPVNERLSIQSDLTWTGDYNGLIDGVFSDRLVAAVKAFQRRNKTRDTGVLNPQEREILAASAKPLQDEVGWQLVEDPITGARIGLPARLATEIARAGSGTRWSSAQGQLQIETFRIAGTRLEPEFERQKRRPVDRRPAYNVLRPDFFVISGMQGLKKFYVRAFARGDEVRGITILYDQAMEGTMDSVVVAMSSAFVPFGVGSSAMDPSRARRKVEYGTGLIVSSNGHVVTDKQNVDGCRVITIPGLGHAERLVEDRSSELALLRVYGVRDLKPIALFGPAPRGDDVTLVGVADPQAQGGGNKVSTAKARLGAGNPRSLDTPPVPGFSGAAVLDAQGRMAGMAVVTAPVVAGPAPTVSAAMVPLNRVVNFVEANYIAAQSGPAGAEAASAAVVRVICVRP